MKMLCTHPGDIVVAPIVPPAPPRSALSDQPFTFEQLAARWACSVDAVRDRVPPSMIFRMGRTPLVRPADVLRLEERRLGV